MAMREIIEIDETRCDGCGACETGCPEGALRIIDGKARLVGESLCDGLGACIGNCPRGAIKVTRREAEPYSEAKVIEGIAKLGPKVVEAHFDHLLHHGQDGYAREALAWLEERGIAAPASAAAALGKAAAPAKAAAPRSASPAAGLGAPGGCSGGGGGCPGSASRRFTAGSMRADAARALVRPASAREAAPGAAAPGAAAETASRPSAGPSALSHWPIQLHLVNPRAPQYAAAELLVAADCTAFALGSFHADFLAGKSLVIACPKLDQGREIYVEKLAALIDAAAGVSVAIMEVPCCSGLVKLLLEARGQSEKKPAIEVAVLGIEGGIVKRMVY